jgi:hypothetical protein
MEFSRAIKLHNEDEVTVKSTNETMQVVEVEIDKTSKTCSIMLTDGNCYHHRDLK